MKGNIQLGIPTPCLERWEDMRPEEKGRYCGACSKTVVDFSMMSDREIIDYLSRTGQQVCGRLAPGQLNRGLALESGVGKGRRGWWHWLLAGLLVASEADAQRQPLKTGSHQAAGAVLEKMLMGDTVMMVPEKIPVKRDTIRAQELPAVVVRAYATMGKMDLCGTVGGLAIRSRRVDSPMQWVRDTLAMVGLLRKKELNVYPNPVRRGSPVMLTWQAMEM
ncbi:MAG TPA: hypothetical protein VNU70_07835, partial [Puia sp.]|nr:hypothetical protein [Puia sp.]